MTTDSNSIAAESSVDMSEALSSILIEVQEGRLSVTAALERLRDFPIDKTIANVQIDTQRELRTGVAEVVLCAGKTVDQVVAILCRLREHHGRALGTRATPEMAQEVVAKLPDVGYDPVSRLLSLNSPKGVSQQRSGGTSESSLTTSTGNASGNVDKIEVTTAVVSGGTADLPVAEEAAQTLEFLFCPVSRIYDVGVAGIHRLLSIRPKLAHAAVVISVAGMEGALTSVVAGLVPAPVIGVPTSIGYGANLGGASALLTMLNSCASGVAVVNIDNGFGAALMAHAIVNRIRSAAGK